MNGSRYFLDTNAIIALLRGNSALATRLQECEWIGISVISQLEFMAYQNLTEQDRELFMQFCSRIQIIDLCAGNTELIENILHIRIAHKLKLPDAVIAASAIQQQAVLVTEDSDFNAVAGLQAIPVSVR